MHRTDAGPAADDLRSPFRGAAAVLFLLWAPTVAFAQDPDAQGDPWKVAAEDVQRARAQPLFAATEPLELTLSGPFTTIRKEDRGDETHERRGTLTLQGPDGRDVVLATKLEARGNWRRDRHNCDFPPLWIDLDKDQPELEGTPFEGQNRVKLYVTCKPGKDDYEQYILQEYLIYPTHNLLTDESFRARLARVRYEDTDDPGKSFTSWAFLLEHKDRMAARNEGVPLEAPQVHPANMQPEKATLGALFNFMIGMTDWSAVFRHNVEVIREMDGSVVPVSYDFDWSGIVNTRYARPDPKLGIRTVRERRYQGFCQEIDADAVFQRFVDRREEILALWRGFDLVEPDRREKAVDYLEDFFDRIADAGRRERILRDCTPIPR
jgi:hypothetical protein